MVTGSLVICKLPRDCKCESLVTAMTWCPPIREEPRKLTLPPGKLGLTAKQYSDEFIITEVTSDDGMTLQGYHGTSPGNALRGMSIISVDGEELKSLVDLSTECDKSREVMVHGAQGLH